MNERNSAEELSEAELLQAVALASTVQVTSGAPDETEVAALVASLVTSLVQDAGGEEAEQAPVSQWNSKARAMRLASVSGNDSWRWSLR